MSPTDILRMLDPVRNEQVQTALGETLLKAVELHQQHHPEVTMADITIGLLMMTGTMAGTNFFKSPGLPIETMAKLMGRKLEQQVLASFKMCKEITAETNQGDKL